jgi:hypothetical protein
MNINPQAIAFVQNYVRGTANAIGSALLTMQKCLNEWNLLDIAAVIPNDSNVIQDGNALQPLTDAQVQIFIANLSTILAIFTNNSNLIENQQLVAATSYNSQV